MLGYSSGQMMGWGGSSFFGTLGLFTWLVWLVAGILVCVWLWQKISKK
ncbi:MAG: hypothetical protein HYT39_02220 [Candidatus Sungbacteria bacterium]|nr:hypothetical protein [Candidatus Sungbacteria bacterium]